MAGVIGHIANPTLADNVALARAAEEAGASWIGLADAFWWRDVWMALAAVADATSSIEIGPAMTNPYMRHPFQTVAALATLQELAPDRTFAGITAGGSEVTAAAGIARTDAPVRVRSLVDQIRQCAQGLALDAASGRRLDVAITAVPILIAGRGDEMLRTAGAIADRVLLWAIPDSDLDRSVDVIREAAIARDVAPSLVWAPLVEHDPALREKIMHVAVYASLNTRPEVRRGWGLDDQLVDRVRADLVRGDIRAAAALVPPTALDDLVVSPDVAAVAARANALGCSTIAVPGYSVADVAAHVGWARRVEELL